MVDTDQQAGKLRWWLPRWLYVFAPRPFDGVQWFLYAAVMINFITVSCACDFSWPKVNGLLAAITALFAIDRWEHARYKGVPPTRVAVVILLLRIALIEVVAQIDGFDISSFLYVLLPFTAVVAFDTRAGWVLGVLIWVRYVVQVEVIESSWYNWRSSSDVLLFSLGIIFVLTMARLVVREQAHRARAEKLLADLEDSHQQLRVYATQVADLATASERNRLARDIHDSLGHYLTVINVQLEKALAFRSKDAEVADRAVEDSKRLAREALDDVRRSVGMLRASQQVFSLRDALHTLVERTRSEHLHVTLRIDGDEHGVSPQALMALYRVAQEGLTNVQRHAQAAHVTITADLAAQEVRLSVADDGVGFDPTQSSSRDTVSLGGYGLRGVQERLELVAGSLQIVTQPGRGTQLTGIIPRLPLSQGGQL